jgi:hypothetical protein
MEEVTQMHAYLPQLRVIFYAASNIEEQKRAGIIRPKIQSGYLTLTFSHFLHS